MPAPIPIYSGYRFGKLTIIAKVYGGRGFNYKFVCRCDCGRVVEKPQKSIKSLVANCGCSGRQGRVLNIEDFERRYVKSKTCWNWVASKDRKGYGAFKGRAASRSAWLYYVGKIPKGLSVCHKCDSPSCVNPDHLFLGTHKDNMDDRNKKGRQKGPKSIFTDRQIRKIFYLYDKGTPQVKIAKKMKVKPQTIWSIVHSQHRRPK